MTDAQGQEYIKVGDARQSLGISQKRMSELMKNGTFEVYTLESDHRVKLLLREQVDAYAKRLHQPQRKSA
ncbi:MAG TPA: hypothetical protein VFN11_14365 [Ktedonobacterales bacterium]|nr:hypothetical protein [Ktedonobacterales bacterium]